jgi:FkbM family methyltransferase
MFDKGELERIKITLSCGDCEDIPKVHNAGKIVDGHQIMHNGLKVVHGGYHGDWMAEIIKSLHGHHEPQEEKAFYEILKDVSMGGVMIECGSNWSYYSAWFNKSVEDATNIMIEPTNKKLEVGKKNFEANNMKGIFENAFVGRNAINNAKFVDWDRKVYNIDQVCIDDIVDRYNLDKVDIVHADIQGAELEMLYGSIKSIAKNKIRYFIISTHGDVIHDYCERFLRTHGFYIICDHTIAQSYSADGLIVASHSDSKKVYVSKRGTQ